MRGHDTGDQERISAMTSLGNESLHLGITSFRAITPDRKEILFWVNPKDSEQMRKLGRAFGYPWIDLRREATGMQRRQRRRGGSVNGGEPSDSVIRFFAEHGLGNLAH
ncbi:hypothetical protein KKC00_02515 [Patescibacteria group bacterium]|nr:hypothetical protein [Patescibacteria group bacterium]